MSVLLLLDATTPLGEIPIRFASLKTRLSPQPVSGFRIATVAHCLADGSRQRKGHDVASINDHPVTLHRDEFVPGGQ